LSNPDQPASVPLLLSNPDQPASVPLLLSSADQPVSRLGPGGDLAVYDIAPCGGNMTVDVDDISAILDAFAGFYACSCPGGTGWDLIGNSGTDEATDFVGTTDNVALNIRVNNQRVMRYEPDATAPNVIGGFAGNSVTAGVTGATVAGGGRTDDGAGPADDNRITDNFGAIGGGRGNQTGDDAGSTSDRSYATVGGGQHNRSAGAASTVGGGDTNTANGSYSSVGGGGSNLADGFGSNVGGGNGNQAGGFGSTVAGGNTNTASGEYSTVAGGRTNQAGGGYSFAAGRNAKVRDAAQSGDTDGDEGTFIWSDSIDTDFTSTGPNQFLVRASGGVGIGTNAPTEQLDVAGNIHASGTLASGNTITIDGASVPQIFSSSDALEFHVAGDRVLRLEPNATAPNIIAGFSANTVTTGVIGATIAGGGEMDNGTGNPDNNRVTDDYGTIGGGRRNQAGDAAGTTSDSDLATVAGGQDNTASGLLSTVGGGDTNTASGDKSTVGGGEDNTAAGRWSTVPAGRDNNATGDYSFAAGRGAKANHLGAFVWADTTNADFTSSADNQFNVRSSGGVRIFTNTGLTMGTTLDAGDSTWNVLCDRDAKTSFRPVDALHVLERVVAMPVTTWNYKTRDDILHMGVMAQDFHAAFGLGSDDKHISTVDADGVALAAIQGLHQLVEEKDCEIEELKAKVKSVAEMEARIAKLEGMVQALADRTE